MRPIHAVLAGFALTGCDPPGDATGDNAPVKSPPIAVSNADDALGYGSNQMVVRSFEGLEFESRPDGSSLAGLSGDPAVGPSAVLLKFRSGPIPMHWHPSGYHAVVIKGLVKHWAKGEQEAESPLLGPGSYWFQPPNLVHTDACLDSSGECMIFAHTLGPMGYSEGPARAPTGGSRD